MTSIGAMARCVRCLAPFVPRQSVWRCDECVRKSEAERGYASASPRPRLSSSLGDDHDHDLRHLAQAQAAAFLTTSALLLVTAYRC
jgi:hypothetical protein